ncbi:MAG: aminopeptidase P N-terminal domain-containing protein, partial [Acidobacteriota bacterium]
MNLKSSFLRSRDRLLCGSAPHLLLAGFLCASVSMAATAAASHPAPQPAPHLLSGAPTEPAGYPHGAGPQAPSASSPFPRLADYFGADEYAMRRLRLAQEIGNGIVLLLGAKDPMDAWEEHRFDPYFRPQEFKQSEAVIYLTGVQEPGAVLLLLPARRQVTAYLPDVGQAARQRLSALGLETIRPLARLDADIRQQVQARRPFYLLQREGSEAGGIGRFGSGERFWQLLPSMGAATMPEDLVVARFRARFPRAEVRNLLPPLQRAWKVKSTAELKLMRDVAQVSVGGVVAGLRRLRPGMSERQLAGWIEGQLRRHGAQRLAYSADIQSGPNALLSFVTLFRDYDARNRVMRAGEVVLVDHSAEVNYYVSDIARTVPVDGHFSAEFRQLYELYLVAYDAGLQ